MKTILRLALIAALALMVEAPATVRSSQDRLRQTRPNIVLILASDLGSGDLACYGGAKILAPHIDQLARDGIRFTDFHSTSAVSSPARAGELTAEVEWKSVKRIPSRASWSICGARIFAPP